MRRLQRPPLPAARLLALALAGGLGAGAALAETGTALKETPVHAQPQGGAQVLAKVPAKQTVQITARQGAWAGVTTGDGVAGWARILNLRTGSGLPGNDGGAQMMAAFRTGSSASAVPTGVKGLSADQLMSASANTYELELLDGYAANSSQAQQFAAQAPLKAQQVKYLESGGRDRRRQR